MSQHEPSERQPDPLIDEVRRVREEFSNEFGNDPRRLVEELRRVQAELEAGGARIVPAPEHPGCRGTKAD